MSHLHVVTAFKADLSSMYLRAALSWRCLCLVLSGVRGHTGIALRTDPLCPWGSRSGVTVGCFHGQGPKVTTPGEDVWLPSPDKANTSGPNPSRRPQRRWRKSLPY